MEETPRRWQTRWGSNIVVEVLLRSRNTSLTSLRMLNGNQLKNSEYFLNCETEESVQNLVGVFLNSYTPILNQLITGFTLVNS